MNTVKVKKEHAQKLRALLNKKNCFDNTRRVESDKNFVYMPVNKKINLIKGAEYTTKKLKGTSKGPTTLRDALKFKLTEKEMSLLKTSYDIIGEIAILEIEDELKTKEKIIAQTLLEVNKKVKTVLCKAGIHSGEFRTQKMKYLAGVKTKESCVKENNVTICLDVEQVYFSVRLSTERKRISELVMKDEKVLVLFSGCAPYPCVLSKNTNAKEIVGVELNPIGHKYGLKNIKLNKIKNVKLYNDDAKNTSKYGVFDRILMPLPKSAEEFLDSALKCAKKGTKFHMYTFGTEEELIERKKQVRDICKDVGFFIRVQQSVKCGQFAPKTYRFCIDFTIL